jgi:Skp family chaperone for outer membrane proteins
MLRKLLFASLAGSFGLFVCFGGARAQGSGPGWFVPQQNSAAPQAASHSHPAHTARTQPAPAQVPVASPPMAPLGPDARTAEDEQAAPPIPLPPVPDLPALPKSNPPPTAVIGVLGVPDVMRNSVAAQAVEKVIRDRREKLNQDAQKELSTERDMGQALANERAHLSTDQQHAREHELQDRSVNAQKQFRQRNQIIQQAAQYGLSQIERTLIAVIRQVAESHGMNLVVHRAQVALNVSEFDITKQVSEQLNKILPSVDVPPDGMTAAQFIAQKNHGASNSNAASPGKSH